MRTDFYRLLEVDRSGTPADFKKAYYKLAKLYHPDVVIDPVAKAAAEIKFQRITEAYEVLSCPTKRRQYDTLGHWNSGVHQQYQRQEDHYYRYRASNNYNSPYQRQLLRKNITVLGGLAACIGAVYMYHRKVEDQRSLTDPYVDCWYNLGTGRFEKPPGWMYQPSQKWLIQQKRSSLVHGATPTYMTSAQANAEARKTNARITSNPETYKSNQNNGSSSSSGSSRMHRETVSTKSSTGSNSSEKKGRGNVVMLDYSKPLPPPPPPLNETRTTRLKRENRELKQRVQTGEKHLREENERLRSELAMLKGQTSQSANLKDNLE